MFKNSVKFSRQIVCRFKIKLYLCTRFREATTVALLLSDEVILENIPYRQAVQRAVLCFVYFKTRDRKQKYK